MTVVTEIAPDLYRICTYVPEANLQFSQFLAKDEQPLLFHTGLKMLFPGVRDAVGSIIDVKRLRYVAFSHFESDECGVLNDWLALAPEAEPVCSVTAKIVSIDDFASRPARGLAHGEVLNTGKFRFQFQKTPHVPHAWESGLMFEEVNRVLLCSDLLHHGGDPEPVTESDVVERSRETYLRYRGTPLDHYLPYTKHTDLTIQSLADLRPKVCATMHGSTFSGDGEDALRRLATMLRETIGNGRP